MVPKIEFFPENEQENELLERAKFLSQKNFFPFLKANNVEEIKENLTAFKKMPKSEQERLTKVFIEQVEKRASTWFHQMVKERIKEIDKLPVKKRIEYFENEVRAINEAIQVFEWTGIFEINSNEAKKIYVGEKAPVEDYKHLLRIFKSKLQELNQIHADYSKNGHKQGRNEITHRIKVLANWYKSDAKIEIKKTPTQHRDEGGQQRYDAYRQLLGTNKKMNLPKRKEELLTLISYLSDFPEAVALVQQDIDNGNYRK